MLRSVFFIAGELSADRYAASLYSALQRRVPGLRASAIGGPHLASVGVPLLCDSSEWSAIGVVEALRRVPGIWLGQQALKRRLRSDPPDLLIPLDFGAFNVPTAHFARGLGIPVCYCIPPGSWRPDGGRVSSKLGSAADAYLTPFPASETKLRDAGLEAHFLGHPLLDFVAGEDSMKALRESLGLQSEMVIGILPGSRRQELTNLAPVMLDAAIRLANAKPEVQFIVPLARNLPVSRLESLLLKKGWSRKANPASETLLYGGPATLAVVPGRPHDALRVSTAAMICSGTATLEAALIGCPMVITYRGSALTVVEYLLRKSIVPENIGLPNLLSGKRICPELIQENCTAEHLEEELMSLLSSSETRTKQLDNLGRLRMTLGEPGVIDRWADYIVGRWGQHEENGVIVIRKNSNDPQSGKRQESE